MRKFSSIPVASIGFTVGWGGLKRVNFAVFALQMLSVSLQRFLPSPHYPFDAPLRSDPFGAVAPVLRHSALLKL